MKKTTKLKIQGFMAGFIICSILMFNINGFALGLSKTINVIFNSTTVRIDGKVLDGDNISYNNNIYVRLDKVSELLNKTYGYDKNHNVIDLASKAQASVITPSPAPASSTTNSNIKAEEVVVKNVDEFINAIGSNRKIVMKPGVYNLSKVSNHNTNNKSITWEAVEDGLQLEICNVTNLSIFGEGTAPVEIVAEPRFAVVMHLDKCQNITLSNLKVGHTITFDEYDCNAGVLQLSDSKNINISNCILYGCGSEGITAFSSSSLKMENSVIEKCNLRIMSLYESEDFTFTNCKFRETRHLDMFNMFYAKNITFNNCEIRDNVSDYGSLFELSNSVNIKVLNSKIINNKAEAVGSGLILTGTTFRGNSFDK